MLRTVKPEEKDGDPALIVPSSLLMHGGTMNGTPIGMEPSVCSEIGGGSKSTLAAANDAECRQIAQKAAANESVDGESDGRERTFVGEHAEGFDAARTALFEANERTKRAEEAFLSKSNGMQFDDAPHLLVRLLLNPNTRVTVTASSLYPEKMIILPIAFESAEKLDTVSTRGGRFLKLLLKLGSDYFEVLAEKGDAEARRAFSPSDNSTRKSETVRNGNLGRLREFFYNGTSTRMEQHLKIGVSADTSKTLRCCFI